jgi:hypothetical protein
MNIQEALIQRVRERFMRCRHAFDRFNDADAEREKVGPNWNVRDLSGHLLHWITEGADRLPEIAAGKPYPKYEFERTNDEIYKKYRQMSFVMLLPQLRTAEDRFLAAIKKVDDELLIDSPVREWIDGVAIEHYDHHWPGLKAAVSRLD